MTVLTSETSVLSAGARLPRVNLLPPEIAESQKLRKVQLGLGAVVAGAVVVMGGLYVSASHDVSSAQSDLASAQSRQADLTQQISRYADVTQTRTQLDAAQQQLVQAMGDEVRYSFLLNDLSLSVPSTVWLKSLTFAQATPAAAGSPGTTGAAAAGTGPARLATLTVSGTGFSHDDVALWLEALAGQQNDKGQRLYANPYFTNSTEALVGTRKTVNFSSTADLTVTALSGRFLTPRS